MLVKCKNALLLSDVTSFANLFRDIAEESGVELAVESEWSSLYRVTQEVIILGSKYLDSLNPMYYSSVVLILKADEIPYPFIQKGITRFIFDYHNQNELFTALFRPEVIYVNYASKELKDLLKDYNATSFIKGVYEFDFLSDTFRYKGKPIYLPKAQKKYLADWLLNGHKDNSKRMFLCMLRKKFGADFLKDIDRHGEIKEEKDE